MISVNEAIIRVQAVSNVGPTKKRALNKCIGATLAEHVRSPIDMPPFRQSSMDGYALMPSDTTTLDVVDEIQAGQANNPSVAKDQAVRIFTGARVPDACDTVVMQENVVRDGDTIRLSQRPERGKFIRPQAGEIARGDIALRKGTRLGPAALGFLAGLGVTKVPVYRRLRVTVLVTGNELQRPGKKLEPGRVYESNATTLQAGLHQFDVKKVAVTAVKDTLKATKKAVRKALRDSDLVLISGGISVGDYDFVREALTGCGVEEVFYKVNQKPGKPLWFGTHGKTKVFGLPGNPASSLTCFYVYVVPVILAWNGAPEGQLERATARIASDVTNKHGKTLLLKARLDNGKVVALGGQPSSMLRTFAEANVLLMVPPHRSLIKKGEEVSCILLK